MFECECNSVSEWRVGTRRDSFICCSVLMMTETADIDNTGFPPGYFIIRSVASDRLLDVTMDDTEDGTEIGLWPEKEKSLVDSQYLSIYSFLVVNSLSLNLKQAFEILQPITRLVSLDSLSRSMSAYIQVLNRFSSLIHLERCARDPPDTLSTLKVRDLLSSPAKDLILLQTFIIFRRVSSTSLSTTRNQALP